MNTYTQQEQNQLLTLARQSITQKFGLKSKNNLAKIKNNPKFTEKKGTFVTLTQNKNLRGCIGHILPIQKLYQAIIENAQAAAFNDPRFPSLKPQELNKTTIEISILSEPKKLNYTDANDLLTRLKKSKPGVILKRGNQQATFLPQVWEELDNAEKFLSHLCLKAGLIPLAWQKENLDILTYEVVKFQETE